MLSRPASGPWVKPWSIGNSSDRPEARSVNRVQRVRFPILWPHGVAVCISPSLNRIDLSKPSELPALLATPSEETLCGPRSALEDCFIDADPDMPPGLSQMVQYLVASFQIRQADRLACSE